MADNKTISVFRTKQEMTASGKEKRAHGTIWSTEDCLGNEEKCADSAWVASLLSGKSKLVGLLLLDV